MKKSKKILKLQTESKLLRKSSTGVHALIYRISNNVQYKKSGQDFQLKKL